MPRLKPDYEALRKWLYAEPNMEYIGLRTDLTNEAYHAGPGVSKSGLDLVDKSINHFLKSDIVRVETPSMLLGTCVHAALLEPELWREKFQRGPDADRRTKEWKMAEDEAREHGRITLIPTDIYDKVEAIVAGALDNPTARDLLEAKDKLIESSLFVEHPGTGLLMRVRPDLYIPSSNLIVDLKTTKCAAPSGQNSFAKSAGSFNYDRQAAMYSDCMQIHTGESQDFLFIAVENEPPFNCAVYELDPGDVMYGRSCYIAALDKLNQFIKMASPDYITGYSVGVESLKIPKYMRRG